MATETSVYAERVKAAFRQVPPAVAVTVVNAAVMTAALLSVEDIRGSVVWFACVVALGVFRLASWHGYRRATDQVESAKAWARIVAAGALASGLLWGVGAVLLLPQSETLQLFWVFLIGGMCAGAATFHSAHLPTALAFIIPAAAPVAICFAIDGTVRQVAAAADIAVFAVALVFVSWRGSQQVGALTTLQLDLVRKTRELDALDHRLRNEMAEHQATEATLRQIQKMEAIGQLTGGIAHDFNNMLQAIEGSLDLLQHRLAQGQTGELAPYAETARRGVERAAALTQRLLSFARRQPLHAKRVDADALVRGMAELIGRTVGPEIRLDLSLGSSSWATLCDPNELENAVLNLAVNARDAMLGEAAAARDPTLTIATRMVTVSAADLAEQEDGTPGDYVEITMSDNGAGMDASTRVRAFEPFFTTKPVGQGTGLGLSQVYGFVRQSGGIVRLDSEPGQGTSVRLCLPRHLGAAIAEPESPRLAPADDLALDTDKSVLLVEDEESVRALVAEHLGELGYRVLQASDGPAALRLLESESRLDLLVTDVGLPGGMNGRQVADVARGQRPTLPVLFITGYAGRAFESELAPGMEVIGKPFTFGTLVERARAMLAAAAPVP